MKATEKYCCCRVKLISKGPQLPCYCAVWMLCLNKSWTLIAQTCTVSVQGLSCLCLAFFLYYYLCPILAAMCIAGRIAARVHICFRAWMLWLDIDPRSWRVWGAWRCLGLMGWWCAFFWPRHHSNYLSHCCKCCKLV